MMMRVKMKMPKLESRMRRGVEAGAGGAEGSAGEGFDDEGEGEDGEGEREACGGGGAELPKSLKAGGHGPVEERGFLEVADAVGVEGDPVVAEEHLAGDFGVDGVGVVEQRRGEEGEAGVEEDPEGEEDEAVVVAGWAFGHVDSVCSSVGHGYTDWR